MTLPDIGAVRLPQALDVIRAEVREFLQAERTAGRFVPHCDAWLSAADPAFSRRLGEQGWLGMTFPREYGGTGAGALARFVVTEELLAAGAPVAGHWIADRQSGPSILRFGTEEQKQSYLPGIARGETWFAIGMSEPDSGSDLASVRTRATRAEGGWRVSGTKVWTSGAHHAHAMIALVRTDALDPTRRHAGLSQFIIDLDVPGIQITPIRLLSGAHHFNEVVLDDVFVPDGRVLGEIGDGWRQVTSELAWERSGPERFLSTYPLLAAAVDRLANAADSSASASVGTLVARIWTLRQMSISVASRLDAGQSPDIEAALVKDLGTLFEGTLTDAVRMLVRTESDTESTDGLTRLLAESILQMPGFTLRGGTNEILRGVVAKGLGVR
ncbi:acyl-CoA dehydrogenase [Aeromicrobium sp. SMF47]|uniref:acyl-CoA dehydrogenase family protein n=1 Tax=Aeromicrobium yanjiei TaxID=2662028 RepID=UPI00129D9CDD|nr:acyl-CoA dehydrogenase family protein [Aeromicrobium yanjiei]MRJ77348.1 acyl-CoA dehydrogenase [Aeromicrobium yanjiei]